MEKSLRSITVNKSLKYTKLFLKLVFIKELLSNEDMITLALFIKQRKVLWSPGCGSLTEIARAEELGCELVKLFPGSTYGPGFVKAILGPQPWTSIMPTGGVSTEVENLKGWFDAGVTCVGMGSKLISKEILANESYFKLTRDVKKTLETIRELKD
jgi:2-dehydro-3-deoxyphosphogluconate aldolase/(4S)-4-hydroxy-2-oxoglutarate aldolase